MPLKYAILILILGGFITFLGLLFKLESWENATEMLLLGLTLEFAGLVFVVLAAIKKRKDNL